jgi:hypothetical protein
MSTHRQTVRIETLLALAISNRWPRNVPGADTSGDAPDQPAEEPGAGASESELSELPLVLRSLNASDRDTANNLLQRLLKLSPTDRSRWLDSQLRRIQLSTPERDRRFDKDIHPTQVVAALREESPRIQSFIIELLPVSLREPVAEGLGISPGDGVDSTLLMQQPAVKKLAEVVRLSFFGQFVFTTALKSPTPLDLLSGVELARLIRLLGVRETAIACRGIPAVETVTAFLKRFSAEDAHAIVFHLRTLKPVKPERIVFADTVARKAIKAEANIASTMLDRVGLTLLAIVLSAGGILRRRHTAQKLPLAAARELDGLAHVSRTYCDREMAHGLAAEVEGLAENLHRLPTDTGAERRGVPSVNHSGV